MEFKKHSNQQTELNPFVTVSLTDKPSSSINWRRGFCICLSIFLFIFAMSNVILLFFNTALIVGIWISYFKHSRKPKSNEEILKNNLKWFFKNHGLYTEEVREITVKDNGIKKEQKEKYISHSAKFGFKNETDKIIIRAYKTGDNFTSKMNALDTDLSALINLPLSDKKEAVSYVDYFFNKQSDKRIQVLPTAEAKYNDLQKNTIQLTKNIKWCIHKNPHALIVGGTGSGKSTFLFYLIIELLKVKSELYISDPKSSDISDPEFVKILGEERVATDPNNIARITRLVNTEMETRYEKMKNSPMHEFGANYLHYGFHNVVLIFDEMAAFSASADKKISKEVSDNLKNIILKGRQAGVFVICCLQRADIDSIGGGAIRDNLSLKVGLGGALSPDGMRMLMGNVDISNLQPVEKIGTGIIYMEPWKSARNFEAPFFDTNKIDFISEVKKYIKS